MNVKLYFGFSGVGNFDGTIFLLLNFSMTVTPKLPHQDSTRNTLTLITVLKDIEWFLQSVSSSQGGLDSIETVWTQIVAHKKKKKKKSWVWAND